MEHGLWPKKSYKASVGVSPAPIWVPSQRSLAPSVMSVANDKGDNEMMPDLLAFALQLKKTPGNLRRLSDEGTVQPVIASNVPLTPNDVCRITQLIRNGERRKGRGGMEGPIVIVYLHIICMRFCNLLTEVNKKILFTFSLACFVLIIALICLKSL